MLRMCLSLLFCAPSSFFVRFARHGLVIPVLGFAHLGVRLIAFAFVATTILIQILISQHFVRFVRIPGACVRCTFAALHLRANPREHAAPEIMHDFAAFSVAVGSRPFE